MKRILAVALALACGLLCWSGCIGKKAALERGFGYYGHIVSDFLCAVKSDKTEFAIDDVTLDFYFSIDSNTWLETTYEGQLYEDLQIKCVALYFCDSKYMTYPISMKDMFQDYKAIEGHYFIKEISYEEFDAEEYSMTTTFFGGTKFNHKETFTIPQDIFAYNEGKIYFRIMDIQYSPKNDFYCRFDMNEVELLYSKDGTVSG